MSLLTPKPMASTRNSTNDRQVETPKPALFKEKKRSNIIMHDDNVFGCSHLHLKNKKQIFRSRNTSYFTRSMYRRTNHRDSIMFDKVDLAENEDLSSIVHRQLSFLPSQNVNKEPCHISHVPKIGFGDTDSPLSLSFLPHGDTKNIVTARNNLNLMKSQNIDGLTDSRRKQDSQKRGRLNKLHGGIAFAPLVQETKLKFRSCDKEQILRSAHNSSKFFKERKIDPTSYEYCRRKIQILPSTANLNSIFHCHNCITSIGDPKHQIYRLTLPPNLSPLIDLILSSCKRHITSWETNIYSLTKQDVALRDVPGTYAMASPIVQYIKNVLKVLYIEAVRTCSKNQIDSISRKGKITLDRNQPHVLKYSTENKHTGVGLHHDNCDFTVNLMMSRREDYEGGGTYFVDANEVVKLNYGDFLLHPGRRVHSGLEITKGSRYLMIFFANLVH